MSLRELYRAELAKVEAAKPDCGPYEGALAQLRAFAAGLPAELTAMGITPFEVELFEDEDALRIDTGPCMIVMRPTQTGGFRLTQELKRPDDYAETEIPDVDSIEQAEAAIARLLVGSR